MAPARVGGYAAFRRSGPPQHSARPPAKIDPTPCPPLQPLVTCVIADRYTTM